MFNWQDDSGKSRKLPNGMTEEDFENNQRLAVEKILRLTRKVLPFNTKGMNSVEKLSIELMTDEKDEEIEDAYAKLHLINEESGHKLGVILPMNKNFTFKI